MGGWHITHRATKNSNYKGVTTTIDLPSKCGCENDTPGKYDGVFPEFIHGFYGGSYGLDVGIVFRNNQFQIFYHSLKGTCTYQDPTNDNPPVVLSSVDKEDTIKLRTTVSNHSQIILAEVLKNNYCIGSYEVPLTKGAYNHFKENGAIINREILMASNRHNYIPCNAYYSDILMRDTSLTTIHNHTEKLTKRNSVRKIFSDEGNLNGSLYEQDSWEDSGYIFDLGSCDFRESIDIHNNSIKMGSLEKKFGDKITITLNIAPNKSSLSKNIFLLESNGKNLGSSSIKYAYVDSHNDNKIIVIPKYNNLFSDETYYLYITENLKSKSGKYLGKNYYCKIKLK